MSFKLEIGVWDVHLESGKLEPEEPQLPLHLVASPDFLHKVALEGAHFLVQIQELHQTKLAQVAHRAVRRFRLDDELQQAHLLTAE